MGLKVFSSIIDICDLNLDCIQKALGCVPTNSICGVVFCGTTTAVPYHDLLNDLKSFVYDSLGHKVPVTLIPQYLLPQGGLSLEIYALDDEVEIKIGEQNNICYAHIENKEESSLIIEGIPASDFTKSVHSQSEEIFKTLDNILSSFGFSVDDIVRQWNYIGNIVSYRDGKQNYQEFNDARSRYYAQGDWHNGYPAATGIGISSEGIIVGGIAFKKAAQTNKGVYPIDNPLQVAAHVYSKSVLIDNGLNAVKSTPKFERAKLIETKGGAYCFVSGTAAIRGEQSMNSTSAKLQTIMTIENIEHLVSKENLLRYGCKAYDLKYAKLHIFIKNPEDYEQVKTVAELAYPHLPIVYTVADVCRGELLVEIEGILIS